MKCEICGDEIPGGHDGRELAKVMGLRQKGDFDPFPLCRACYNDIERAIANAWLEKVMEEK